jgi:hypothetical protein
VEEAAESVSSDDLDVGVDGGWRRAEWAGVAQRSMWLVPVEMGFILRQDLAQVMGVHDEDPVREFMAYAADPAFHDGVAPHPQLHLMVMDGIDVSGSSSENPGCSHTGFGRASCQDSDEKSGVTRDRVPSNSALDRPAGGRGSGGGDLWATL